MSKIIESKIKKLQAIENQFDEAVEPTKKGGKA